VKYIIYLKKIYTYIYIDVLLVHPYLVTPKYQSRYQTLSDLSRRDLATCNTLPCPKEIQSVTQSHDNVYTRNDNWRCAQLPATLHQYLHLHAVVLVCKLFFALLDHGAVSALCLACGDEALPREQRVLNSTNGQI